MSQPGLFDVGDWVLAQDCLSPKLLGGWHVFYWEGPQQPACWTQDPSRTHVFTSPEAAIGTWQTHIKQNGSPYLARLDVRAVILRPIRPAG